MKNKKYVYAFYIDNEIRFVCATEEYAQNIKKDLEKAKEMFGTEETYEIKKIRFENF